MTSRNIPLLEQTLQHVLDDPAHHYQATWFAETSCGTVACFGGWALLLDGMSRDELRSLFAVPEAARRRLGLTVEEAFILFNGDNTPEMLTLMVKDLVNGDRLLPNEFYKPDQQQSE